MKILRGDQLSYEAASHEDPAHPGVLKKVLVHYADLLEGRLQMINWAMLPPSSTFRGHYHEDMQEIFIIVDGSVEILAGAERDVLRRGDAVIIEPREPHSMRNLRDVESEYIALGISSGKGGRTILA